MSRPEKRPGPLIAVSSIGPRAYDTVEYCFRDKGKNATCTTPLFPLAVDHIFGPDGVFLMVTREARESENYRRISESLGSRLREVLIPAGRDDAELWDIFDAITKALPMGARIVFDLTHSLRSLSFVIFGVISYLRATQGFHVERVVYGAYEMREKGEGGMSSAPVLDLTLLLSFDEWFGAIDAFRNRTEGARLAELLEQAHLRGRVSGETSSLQRLSRSVKRFSDAVRILRPLDALEAAYHITERSGKAEADIMTLARPLGVVLSRLRREVGSLAVEPPLSLTEEHLRRQFALNEHYFRQELIVQAVLLCREWVISWVALRIGEQDRWLKRDLREGMAFYLSKKSRALRRDAEDELKGSEAHLPVQKLDALCAQYEIVSLWTEICGLRNDVAHCAMNENPRRSETIRNRTSKVIEKMGRLLELDSGTSFDTSEP